MSDTKGKNVYICIKTLLDSGDDFNPSNIITTTLMSSIEMIDTIYTYVAYIKHFYSNQYSCFVIIKCSSETVIDNALKLNHSGYSTYSYLVFNASNDSLNSDTEDCSHRFIHALGVLPVDEANTQDMTKAVVYSDNIEVWQVLLNTSKNFNVTVKECLLNYSTLKERIYMKERNLSNAEISEGIKSFLPDLELNKVFPRSGNRHGYQLANASKLVDKIDNMMDATTIDELSEAWTRGKKFGLSSANKCRVRKIENKVRGRKKIKAKETPETTARYSEFKNKTFNQSAVSFSKDKTTILEISSLMIEKQLEDAKREALIKGQRLCCLGSCVH